MESEVKYGMITKALTSTWKESLNIVGHAVCVVFLAMFPRIKKNVIRFVAGLNADFVSSR